MKRLLIFAALIVPAFAASPAYVKTVCREVFIFNFFCAAIVYDLWALAVILRMLWNAAWGRSDGFVKGLCPWRWL